MRRDLILVPLKAFEAAKSRLSADLSTAARAALARQLFLRTLEFLAPHKQGNISVIVLSNCSEAKAIAETRGVSVLADRGEGDLSQALTCAAEWAEDEGFSRLCIIPADLVAPSQEELTHLLNSDAPVTICPSEDGGTNALLLDPPTAIPLCYGPRSAALHLAAAQRAGLPAKRLELESFRFDLDTGACLARALTAVPELKQACG